MDLLGRLRYSDPPQVSPPPVDHDAVRAAMLRDDPEYARVRQVQHDQLQAITARRLADGVSLHREAEFWRRHGHQK